MQKICEMHARKEAKTQHGTKLKVGIKCSMELSNKVCKKCSKVLGKGVCNESSQKLGNKDEKKSSKELGKRVLEHVATKV